MSTIRDVKLAHLKGQNGMLGIFDSRLDFRDFQADETLETAVIISLFTDRRADFTEPLPFNETFRRGWWGDSYAEIQGDQIGSHLWLLQREKITQDTLNRAKEYSLEALAWLTEDGIAESVQVNTAWINKIQGIMSIEVFIQRLNGTQERYNLLWNRLLYGEPSTAIAKRKIIEAGTGFLATDDGQVLEI
jgi:phage gp46-like protein